MKHIEKPKQSRIIYNKKYLFIFLVMGLLGISFFSFALLVSGNTYITCFNTLFPSNAVIEERAFFKLPSSAYNLSYSVKGSNRGCVIWVKFEIQPHDIEELQNSTLIRSFDSGEDDPFFHFQQMKDWILPIDFIVGYGNQLSYPYISQRIIVDIHNKDHFIVYIIVTKDWL
jgi:hypothetical protein